MDQGRLLVDYEGAPRRARVVVKLNVRAAPTRTAVILRRLDPALSAQRSLVLDRLVEAEAVSGNNRWYRLVNEVAYVWAGGVDPEDETLRIPLPSGIRAKTIGGVIKPLDQDQLRTIYGDLDPEPTSGGKVRIRSPGWESANLVAFSHPVLSAIGVPELRVHGKAESAFQAAFDSIQTAGLGRCILTCGGTFVPRFVNHDPGTGKLSSHSWGIAIDLNVAWNGYRVEPAPVGTVGSVRELVPHFAAQGFAWGGHFSAGSRDGMHFELARLDL